MQASKEIQEYFHNIEYNVKNIYDIATNARKKGFDPEEKVDIPLAKGISERVEGLISAVVPEILNSGVAKRITELEKEYGLLDWRVALKIAEEVAFEKFCKFESKIKAMETAVRVGLAYITLGVISAPLEGFIELKAKKRKDGKEYISAFYAGPIRAAGGTAEAVSLIIADYVRLKCGYEKYDPTEKEIKRYVIELRDYHERVTNLQYNPSEQEIEFLIKNLPIEINGDPTEEIEVSNYKDLERIETNRIRGGLCLVLGEGLAQKSPKLFKQIKKWGKSFNLEWDFLAEFLEIQKKIKAKAAEKKATQEKKIEEKILPNYTFIKDLVAGRPVISFPLKYSGLRLRYGRTRTTGLAAAAIHPETMSILNEYIAFGTQIKIERPGKAAAITSCDYIDGPIVKLKNGSVIKLENQKINNNEIEKILFLGDILINYGDFSENGHKLVPAGYCQEWWIKEFEKAIINLYGTLDLEKLSFLLKEEKKLLFSLFENPIKTKINYKTAKKISILFKIPLHPDFIFYWTAITNENLLFLIKWLSLGKVIKDENKIKIVLKNSNEKEILEKIGLEHLLVNNEFVVIENETAFMLYDFFLKNENNFETIEKIIYENKEKNILEVLKIISGFTIRDKAGTFIGARMGRPEKAKMRKLNGSPHFLFPVGSEGGKIRSIQTALENKKITAEFALFYCNKCKKETIFSVCEYCNNKTKKIFFCEKCGFIEKKCNHDKVSSFKNKEININEIFNKILEKYNFSIYPDLIKGVKGTSNKDHIPEHLVKGILRAKHNIYVNKDGTTRYDMIEVPITHFKPKEIGTSIEKLKELGYLKDIKGNILINDEQVLELKPQDVIMPASLLSGDEPSDDVLFRIANYIDDLLEILYKEKRYYNLKNKKDIVGHLIIGLAPHTSAGIIGRIIGFSKTQGMLTHPLYHAAMRRNCDGDEACAILLMDGLLNFSRSFLPDKRGSRTMDAPLVLTTILIPGEVDDEVHGLDVVWQYPLEFYEAAQQYKNPWDVKIAQIDTYLNTERQYEKMGYTHETTNINNGVLCSSYKLLPTMEDKLKGQMDLADKINAVNADEVAQMVIEKHFLKDIKGNLRKFSTQQFRCSNCNKKFRRPPLKGKCDSCNGKLTFTISEGSIIKYLEPTLSMSRKYKLSTYLMQSLEILQRQVESILGKEKEIQSDLGKWFG
ncbi:MAG: DNA polymerase II large subunit [Candidatus Woesearchaeota archaeon]